MTSSAREALARALRRRTQDTGGSLSNTLCRELASSFGVSTNTVKRVHQGLNPASRQSTALSVEQKVAVARFAGNVKAAHRW